MAAIVEAFRSNDCRPVGSPDGSAGPELLRPLVSALDQDCPIQMHGYSWRPEHWREAFTAGWTRPNLPEVLAAIDQVAQLTAPDERGFHPIQRRHLYDLACGDPVLLLIATIAWGHRPGRGMAWYQALNALEKSWKEDDTLDTARDALAAFRDLARGGDPEAVAAAWTGKPLIPHLGPAYATKYAHFGSYAVEDASIRPLIADQWVAWSLWALADEWDVRRSGKRYCWYVETADRWASDLACGSDEVERALFWLGGAIKKAYEGTR